MSGSIAKQAVVIGAGMGGLCAAKAVAPFFETVTVLERDALPQTPSPRAGTPQDRQLHVLLAGGSRALESLFGGIENKLIKAGAAKVQLNRDVRLEYPGCDFLPRRDLGVPITCQSRPLLEWICRQELQREPNVEIRPRRRVSALSPSADLDAVTGVQFDQDGAVGTIPADLIIDASGRAAPTLSFLEATGRTKPPESEIGIDMAYGSVIFEPPSDPPDWKLVNHLAAKPQGLRSGVIAPLEGERWIVTLMGAHGDGPPNDLDGFRAFAKSLRAPTIYNAIEGAKPLSDIIRFNLPSSLMRHFDKVERFPRGLIPLGDSICRFNPVFGQGMSVAAQQAVALRHILESRRAEADPLAGLADAFFAEARATVETPWAVAMSDLAYPQTRGERPADFAQRMQFQARLQRLMIEDPTVQKVVTEVNHLVRPRSALRDPELVERVRAAPLS